MLQWLDYSVVFSLGYVLSRLLQLLQRMHPLQDLLLTRLRNLPRQHELVQNVVNLVEVKHNVQLANVGEVRVEELHEEVNRLEVEEFVVRDVDGDGEEETGVPAVDELVVIVLDELREGCVRGGGGELWRETLEVNKV